MSVTAVRQSKVSGHVRLAKEEVWNGERDSKITFVDIAWEK